MDVSAGIAQSEVAKNFPNGLPCVSCSSPPRWSTRRSACRCTGRWAGGAAGKAAARRWVILAVAANLITLGVFKYFDFFAANLNDVLGVFRLGAPLPLLHIILPVGISFLVFRMLTYVIDIYRGQLEPAPALDFAVYMAFFPYLLAGPIARAREFLPQLTSPRNPHAVDSSRAFVLILGGLVKKMLIADYLSTHIVNGLFASPQTYSSWETLWGIIAYSVQIYCDFSAYADIAIGIALLLGFELPANFDAPYTARSIQDFWRRWHITLSSWLRDYLYIPLGGNRKGKGRTYANLVITFLLGGLWHGAGWTFVFWGLMHGTGLAVERARMDTRHSRGLPEPGRTPGARALQRLWVFVFVSVAWVFFRAESHGQRVRGAVAADRRAGLHRRGGDVPGGGAVRARHRHPVRAAAGDREPGGRLRPHRLGGPGARAGAGPVPDRRAGAGGTGRVPVLQVLSG